MSGRIINLCGNSKCDARNMSKHMRVSLHVLR